MILLLCSFCTAKVSTNSSMCRFAPYHSPPLTVPQFAENARCMHWIPENARSLQFTYDDRASRSVRLVTVARVTSVHPTVIRADDSSEKHESNIWCHCRDVSKVWNVFPSGLWALSLLLSSAQILAWKWTIRSAKVLFIYPCNGIRSYCRASQFNHLSMIPTTNIEI